MTVRSRQARPLAVGLAAALFLAGCGGSSSSDASDDGQSSPAPGTSGVTTGLVNLPDAPEPVQGGTLSMAAYSEIRSLDPAVATGSGTAGGTELNAIYDVLMRYDPATGEYEPKLAESLEASDDNKTWTLTLRPGVTFTDGTALDAEAVAFSINRYVENNGRYDALVEKVIASMDTPDATTVVFNLNEPWGSFPWLLAYSPGNIVSPTASEALGEDFGRAPVGAGPFTLARFAPGEELALDANPDYWDGRPYLDRLRFVTLAGARANAEALASGQVQAAYLRDPAIFREAMAADQPGYVEVENLGGVLVVNNREGSPGADVRVRQAIAHAIDPEVIDQRAYGGVGLPSGAMFREPSAWATETGGPEYDPAKAKELLAEAKADGYDGALNIVTNNTPVSTATALASQAMLNAVGFTATVDGGNTIQEHIRKVLSEHNFDIATYGMTTPDAAPWVGLYSTLDPESTGNISGYSSDTMNDLLSELQAAAGREESMEVLEQMQQEWNETVPAVAFAGVPALIAWDESVHGIVPTVNVELLFDKAFLAQ